MGLRWLIALVLVVVSLVATLMQRLPDREANRPIGSSRISNDIRPSAIPDPVLVKGLAEADAAPFGDRELRQTAITIDGSQVDVRCPPLAALGRHLQPR
jgi:hypothetical protein